jgi:hypothetical protein
MSGRCSETEALGLLRPAFEPMEAADRLTQAVHRNMRLYCDGEIVPANFRKRLMVVAKPDPDGRWTAAIVSAVREAWERPTEEVTGELEFTGIEDVYGDLVFKEVIKPPYQWEFDADEVKALLLLPPPPPGRRKEPPEYEEIRQFAARKWPNGYEDVKTSHIIDAANKDKKFKERVSPFPSRYQFERALGRRKQ